MERLEKLTVGQKSQSKVGAKDSAVVKEIGTMGLER